MFQVYLIICAASRVVIVHLDSLHAAPPIEEQLVVWLIDEHHKKQFLTLDALNRSILAVQ